MTPIDRLRQRMALTTLDADAADAFAHEAAPGLLLLPGDPLRPEVTDVAVVLGELAIRFPHLRVAIAHAGDEPAMRARFGVTAFPALLFLREGKTVSALTRMQAWSAYESAARALEEPS